MKRRPPPHFGEKLPGHSARGNGPRTKKAKSRIIERAEREAAKERERLRPPVRSREEEEDG